MNGNILIIGSPGQGKSTLTKKLIENAHPSRVCVFDVNGEYSDSFVKPAIDFDKFLFHVKNNPDSINIFEEATMFFSSKSMSKEMTEILIRRRHMNHLNVLLFHSCDRDWETNIVASSKMLMLSGLFFT